jgi:regulator of replication initiation timing
LRDLSDLWQDVSHRPKRFQETERLFGILKDNILVIFDQNPTLWLEYHRLAQNLNELRLGSSQENQELQF